MSNSFADRFFKDNDGNVVIFQSPNRLALAFTCFAFLSIVFDDGLRLSMEIIAFGLGFAWAYIEFSAGVNGFRKTLGFIVMIVLIALAYSALN